MSGSDPTNSALGNAGALHPARAILGSVTDNGLGLDFQLVSKPVFVGLDAASSESGDAWEGFLTGLGERGLRCPLLVISDGAAGLIGALERTMGAALRQRCLVHRARNVLAKVPKNAQAQVKADYWAIFDVPDKIEPGLDAVGYVQKRIDSFEKRWRDSYPAACGACSTTATR